MDLLNWLKVITAIITVIFSFIAGYIELRKNPKYWLNRIFALFFSSVAMGFLLYTIYHLILTNANIIVPIMVTAQILYNFGIISCLMTVFILEKSEKIAMTPKYLGFCFVIFIAISFGFFIWIPTLNIEEYKQGIVDTETPLGWFLFVNVARLVIFIFVLYKYAIITMHSEAQTKKRVIWFFYGALVGIIGVILNLIGGILSSVIIEILGLVSFDIGEILIVKGFLIK